MTTQPIRPAAARKETPHSVVLPLATEDAWLVFHDPEDLTGDDYKAVVDKITGTADQLENRVLGVGVSFTEGMTCVLIKDWHIPYTPKGTNYQPGQVPLPAADPFVFGKLRIKDYRTALDLAAPLVRHLTPRDATPDDAGVPGSPTSPVGG